MNSSPKTVPSPKWLTTAERFFQNVGTYGILPEGLDKRGACSDLICHHVIVKDIQRGRVTCTVTVKPPISNVYGTLQGGGVGIVAELVAVACAKTVTEKDLFIGELSVSYLSAALVNSEVEVCGTIVRQGRNVTVVSVEFRMKETKKSVYTARATLYNVPVASL